MATLEDVKQLYSEGAGDIQVMKHLRLTKKDFQHQYDTRPEFKKVVDQGRVDSEAWWAEQGKLALSKRDFNNTVWGLVMKNRFGWAEKTTQNAPEPEQKSTEQLQKEVREYMESNQGKTAH